MLDVIEVFDVVGVHCSGCSGGPQEVLRSALLTCVYMY